MLIAWCLSCPVLGREMMMIWHALLDMTLGLGKRSASRQLGLLRDLEMHTASCQYVAAPEDLPVLGLGPESG